MSSDSDNLFLTQSTFKENSSANDTDAILDDVLDMEVATNIENKTKQPNFNVKCDIFSDISDDEMVKITQVERVERRFHTPLKELQLQEIAQCQNTENKFKWAVRIFEAWRKERNELANNTKIAKDLLSMSNSELNSAVAYFVAKVKNQVGKDYRPNTLYEMVIAIQHYLRRHGHFVNILDDNEFGRLRQVLDARMKSLSKQGLGVQQKQAQIITEEQENFMWQNNILGTDTPQKLLDTVVYVLGLNFALRAGQEHRGLRFGENQQITLKIDFTGKRYLQYEEDVSKTNAGGLLHRKVTSKITRAYENNKQPETCPVKIYEKYTSLRPQNSKTDAFYLRPLKYTSNSCWYCDVPVGVHTLQQTVAKLCQEAGFVGNYTNHFLRATAATRLYNAGLDEQLVSEKTGHRSTAVRSYKRTSDRQMLNVSDIVQGNVSELGKPASKKPAIATSTKDKSREITVSTESMSFNLKF